MKIKKNKLIAAVVIIAVSFTVVISCKKEEVKNPQNNENESELITSVKLTLTDVAGVAPTIIANFKDVDGEGGQAPSVFESITLQKQTTYTAVLKLLDESKNPSIDLSAEIKKEATDHLFVFTPLTVNITVSVLDKDANNLPLGLESSWVTGEVSMGKVKIVLRHQPGIKDGTPTPGDTDIELDFEANVK